MEIDKQNFESMVDDCKAIVTEGVFASRWTLIEAYHSIGKRIREEQPSGEVKELVQDVARELGKSERIFYYAVKFYDTCPILDNIEEVLELPGKNASWTKVIKKLGLPKDEGIKENKKYTLNQALTMMKEECDKTENEGGRLLIEWFKENYLNI